MKVKTKYFGDLHYTKEEVIQFSSGLPGFTKLTKFVIVQKEDMNPFSMLQSVERGDVSFAIVSPEKFKSDYRAMASVEELAEIRLEDPTHARIFALVTTGDGPEDVSMNLRAPIIINERKKLGAQIILRDSDYDIEYRMFASSGKKEVSRSRFKNSQNYMNASC